MDLGLSGKAAIVTGASRGIGEAIGRVLAEHGVDVCLVARSKDDLAKVAADIKAKTSRRVVTYVADLSNPTAPEAAVKAAVDGLGRLDILVNNAGATKRGDFFTLTEEDWASGFGLKFYSAVRMTRNAWPHLKASKSGAIVNIIGIGARVASAEFTIGGSVNSALVNFTKATADMGQFQNVRVNALNPGHVHTSRLEARVRKTMEAEKLTWEEAIKRDVEHLGINRFADPREIADLVVYLCSSRASFINGSVIDIDGGQTKAL
jgi:NAD(P)-dependent dehydrogenase (short-subunit alcohol dehydrogenase family)